MATGDIHVTTGQMDIANDVTALVAGGNVVVDGLGPNSSLFKGIVFAEGSIEFKRTTVVGASISADANGSVLMDEVKAVNAPETNAVFIQKDITLSGGLDRNRIGDSVMGVLVNGSDFTEFTIANVAALKALAPTLDPGDEGGTWDFVKFDGTSYEPAGGDWSGDDLSARQSWSNYVTEHSTDSVVRIDIFDLNLNRALSITDKLAVKFRSTESYRRE